MRMSVVLQETHLFRGTVRENMLYGKPDAQMHEVIGAAKLANAHEFIQALPYGYGTILGTRGARLSGGRRRRLAIARALIRAIPACSFLTRPPAPSTPPPK